MKNDKKGLIKKIFFFFGKDIAMRGTTLVMIQNYYKAFYTQRTTCNFILQLC